MSSVATRDIFTSDQTAATISGAREHKCSSELCCTQLAYTIPSFQARMCLPPNANWGILEFLRSSHSAPLKIDTFTQSLKAACIELSRLLSRLFRPEAVVDDGFWGRNRHLTYTVATPDIKQFFTRSPMVFCHPYKESDLIASSCPFSDLFQSGTSSYKFVNFDETAADALVHFWTPPGTDATPFHRIQQPNHCFDRASTSR